MPRPRAYLIDASIYIFRAWHVYDNRLTDAEGRPVNAVMGFADFLWHLIRDKQPSHLACAFDESQTDSYRRQLFPQYKANREPAPTELKYQFRLCREFCRAVGIADYGSNRFEADDIIGSLAARLRERGYAITIVSADKDLTQLITGAEDHWWDFARGTVLDGRGVEKQFGVRPEQIADMLALSGDKVDNIPGIPGIGYKMAAKILKKFHSIEHILDNLDQVAQMKFRGAPRMQALLQAHRDLLPLNKRLTTVFTTMDLEHLDLDWKGIDEEVLALLTQHLPISEILLRRWRALDPRQTAAPAPHPAAGQTAALTPEI